MKHRATHYLICSLLLLLTSACQVARLSDARAQFERGEYFEAANTYKKVYNKTSPRKQPTLRGQIAYEMATSYRKINATARSVGAYQYAIRYHYPDSTAYFYLARGQQALGRYKDAVTNYHKFLEFVPNHPLSLNGIKGCELAQEWKENPTRYVVKRANIFNSRRSESNPVLTGDNNDLLYFTSSNDDALGDEKSAITGTKNNDIFLAKQDENGKWLRPEVIEGELNSEMDEGMLCLSPDGNTMYLSYAKQVENIDTSVEIYTSSRSGAKWSAPQKLEVTTDTLSLFAHPAVSPDGLYLYFVSNMPGGMGGKDIWRAPLESGRVGNVENLGSQINTAGDEMFPSLRSNGELYFSSDGHAGMGGLDIFKATQNEYGVWQIENMKAPINSISDDFSITFAQSEDEIGFFSSNRSDARGYDHLYSFELPTIKVWVEGLVLDKEEEPVPDATVRIVGKNGLNTKTTANKSGIYRFRIAHGTEYVMMAGCRGFLNNKQELTTNPQEKDEIYRIDFELPSLTKPVIVDNIFFEFDRAEITPESDTALQGLVKMLEDNPNVSIELAAHTDYKGRKEYNENLSQRRAKAVVDYLIAAGIDTERLVPHGYGESQPQVISKKQAKYYPQFIEGDLLTEKYILALPESDQEIANQLNRRIAFKVLKIDYKLY